VLHAHESRPLAQRRRRAGAAPEDAGDGDVPRAAHARGEKRHAAALAARATDVLVACGEQVRQDILGWAPSGARVPVIANGVPLESKRFHAARAARTELGIPEGAIAVGYVGGLREIKGPDRLLQAFLDKVRRSGRRAVDVDRRRSAGRIASRHRPGAMPTCTSRA